MKTKQYILPIIIIAQFFCTSLWFAGNAILDDLVISIGIPPSMIASILSAVQLGFIIGTLVFAIFTITDRFSPSYVFFICAMLGSFCNLSIVLFDVTTISLLFLRFSTGFFLAGIYPVGMKIAADYYKEGLGKALGYLVGALVLGTAFPHLLKVISFSGNYTLVIYCTSLLALIGGLLILLGVPNGPYRTRTTSLQLNAVFTLFQNIKFRKASFGYFGHMWELYTFWGFLPLLLKLYATKQNLVLNISLWSFYCIAIGSISCIIGGYLAIRYHSKKVALYSLIISGICCLISPLLFHTPFPLFISILLVWGMAVISDSPQFSTLVAQAAPPSLKGTGLTIVNSIGFSLTIISIQILQYLSTIISDNFIFLFLALGPLFGIYHFLYSRKKTV